MFQSRPAFHLSSQNRSAPIAHIMATRSRGAIPVKPSFSWLRLVQMEMKTRVITPRFKNQKGL